MPKSLKRVEVLPGPQQTFVVLQLASFAVVIGNTVADPDSVLDDAQSVVAARVFIAKLYLNFTTLACETWNHGSSMTV